MAIIYTPGQRIKLIATYSRALRESGVEPSLALTSAELLMAENQGKTLTPAQRGIISRAWEQIRK
jgi:hypothetical protein